MHKPPYHRLHRPPPKPASPATPSNQAQLDALNACRADCHALIELAIHFYADPRAPQDPRPGTTFECLTAIRHCIRCAHDAARTANPPLSYRNFAGPTYVNPSLTAKGGPPPEAPDPTPPARETNQ